MLDYRGVDDNCIESGACTPCSMFLSVNAGYVSGYIFILYYIDAFWCVCGRSGECYQYSNEETQEEYLNRLEELYRSRHLMWSLVERFGRDKAFDAFYKAVWDGNMQDKAFILL